jgi:predicted lipoprotein with Yx(FWY)xxD motif
MRRALLLAAVPLAAAALTASSTASAAPPGARAAKVATVKTRTGKLGTYLVDGAGRTLYLFEKDKTSKSRCYGSCAHGWPPLMTTGKPKARGKARQKLLSTSRRRNGKRQVVYHGHPLYYFIADKKAGDTKGQGIDAFGAEWYVVSPAGRKIDEG